MAGGIFLLLAGVWLLMQTLAGDLPGRILSWRNYQAPKAASDPEETQRRFEELERRWGSA